MTLCCSISVDLCCLIISVKEAETMGDGRWAMGDGRWEMGDGGGRWLSIVIIIDTLCFRLFQSFS
eukprot:scaffold15816_cov70-Cyclotella_meneghiniana.AAC.12